jgi:hypothetical protein
MGQMRKMHTKYWPENLKGINHSEELGVNGKKGGDLSAGFIWLRIGTGGGTL